MLSFKQYITESAQGNYVSIDVAEPLPDFGIEKQFPNSSICDFKNQHVTLIYSKQSSIPLVRVKRYIDKMFPDTVYADVLQCEAFDSIPKNGERDENLCTIVLKIKSPELASMNEQLKFIGMTHSYPEFSPHISLIYNFPRDKKAEAIAYIDSKIDGGTRVKLSGYKNNKIIEDWAEKL